MLRKSLILLQILEAVTKKDIRANEKFLNALKNMTCSNCYFLFTLYASECWENLSAKIYKTHFSLSVWFMVFFNSVMNSLNLISSSKYLGSGDDIF